VYWFTAPEDPRGAILVSGDEKLLEENLKMRSMQDLRPEFIDQVSLFGKKMYYESELVGRAYAIAKEKKIDVMHHFHSFGFLSHFYEELTGVPTLYTLHDPVPTPDMLEWWLFQRFPTHKFLSISVSQQGNLKEHFFDNVYNGVDVSRFSFDEQGGETFITVGRMVPVKGHDVAIIAAKQAGVKLTIASWVNDAIKISPFYTEKIEPQIDGINIVVHSLMQGQGLTEHYRKARGLVFPIAWAEPFGLVMIEAMACGTPVIAYNRGSVSEVVVDGVTGFIVDPDDSVSGNWIIKKRGVEGLVEAMKRIGEIDRHACRRHVEEHFSFEKMVEGYERVYGRVVG
jgi:glycosyltransferase involved in cell wall biosynthesis